MHQDIPRGSLPIAGGEDFLCVDDMPGYVHILVGWGRRCKLDGQAAEMLAAFVAHAVRDYREPEVLLDLSNVAYMNSQAVGILAGRILRAVRELGGELRLYRPDPWVRQLLTTLRLDAVLTIVERLPEMA